MGSGRTGHVRTVCSPRATAQPAAAASSVVPPSVSCVCYLTLMARTPLPAHTHHFNCALLCCLDINNERGEAVGLAAARHEGMTVDTELTASRNVRGTGGRHFRGACCAVQPVRCWHIHACRLLCCVTWRKHKAYHVYWTWRDIGPFDNIANICETTDVHCFRFAERSLRRA